MPLLSRIYFNAVFGALGGLMGWVLFGVFGDKNPDAQAVLANAALGGAVIGGAIGYFVVSVEAIRDRSLPRFARLASYGVLLGLVGGALGMTAGDQVNFLLIRLLGDSLPVTMVARGLGWSLLGVAIGMSEGIAARSLGKFSYGMIGGALAAFWAARSSNGFTPLPAQPWPPLIFGALSAWCCSALASARYRRSCNRYFSRRACAFCAVGKRARISTR